MKSIRIERDVIFDQDVEVRMRDGVRLMANVFRPAVDRPCPVVMSVTPYGKDVLPDWTAEISLTRSIVEPTFLNPAVFPRTHSSVSNKKDSTSSSCPVFVVAIPRAREAVSRPA